VIAPRLEWLLPEPILDPPAFPGFDAPVATLLARRGITTSDQLARFLHAGEAALHPISSMADAEAALDRIEQAVDGGEQIAIWGDYDADGMTAVAVWVLALRATFPRGGRRAMGCPSQACGSWRSAAYGWS
jgi:hypothetical protein